MFFLDGLHFMGSFLDLGVTCSMPLGGGVAGDGGRLAALLCNFLVVPIFNKKELESA